MNYRHFFNQKGLTLVELLAALALFGVIITLSTTIIFQFIGGEARTQNEMEVSQEANLAINDLRNQFSNGDSKICLTEQKNKILIKESSYGNGEPNGIINDTQTCIDNIDLTKPLHVKLTEKDSGFTVQSTWHLKDDEVIEIALSNSDSDEEIEDIINDEDNYSNGNTQDNCDFYGNTKFTQTQIGTWNSCSNPTVHDGSAWFPNNISIFSGITFTVDNNFFSDRQFNLEQNAKLNIGNNAKLEGRSTLKSNSTMNVKNLNVLNNLTLQSDSQLNATGGIKIDGELMVQSNSKVLIEKGLNSLNNATFQENTNIKIGKDAIFNQNLKLMGNAHLTVGGNLTMKQDLNLQENNVLSIGKNANFDKSVQLMGNAKLLIKGDANFTDTVNLQSGNKIVVGGDAKFDRSVGWDWSTGTICVEGKIYPSVDSIQANAPKLNIRENATSCNL
jgi:prepilin-type N-terminal cleavage/methylation domain-containing protein